MDVSFAVDKCMRVANSSNAHFDRAFTAIQKYQLLHVLHIVSWICSDVKQKISDLVWGQFRKKVELHPSEVVFLCSTRKALVLGTPVNVAFFGYLV